MKTHKGTKHWFMYVFATSVLSAGCGADPATAPVSADEPLFAQGGGGAHFVGAKAAINDIGQLVVSFKIVGAHDDVGADVTLSADATATGACGLNGVPGGAVDTGTQTVTWTEFVAAGADGKIAGSVALYPAGIPVFCVQPLEVVLISVSYTNVQLTSPTVSTKLISGTFSRTFF